jgi:hypothetical protein
MVIVGTRPARAQGTERYVPAGGGIGIGGLVQWKAPGVQVDVAKPVAVIWRLRTIAAVGELTWLHNRTHDDTTIGGGLRYTRHNTIDKPVLFAQLLLGLNHEKREDGGRNDFRIQPGGGAVFALNSPRVFLKLQNDYAIVPMSTKTKVYMRFSGGVEIHLSDAGR